MEKEEFEQYENVFAEISNEGFAVLNKDSLFDYEIIDSLIEYGLIKEDHNLYKFTNEGKKAKKLGSFEKWYNLKYLNENMINEYESTLLAILASDIVNSSKTMSLNERKGIEIHDFNLKIHIETLKKHNGIFVKEIGDGILATFPSAVSAVKCAFEILQVCRDRDFYKLRIGIHMGEVNRTGINDILGAAVDTTFRIEGKADSNSICISDEIFRNIYTKIDLEYFDLGLIDLKNITEPKRLYKIWRGNINMKISNQIIDILEMSNDFIKTHLKNNNSIRIELTNNELENLNTILNKPENNNFIKLTHNGNRMQNRLDGQMRIGFHLELLDDFII